MELWSSALGEAGGTEAFAATSERFLSAFVDQQTARADLMERWAAAMQEMAGTETFAAASGQLLALYAQQQQALRAASRATAEALQIATTEDLAATSELVINVERKVDEIADGIATLETTLSAHGASVAARLETLEGVVGQLLATPAPASAEPDFSPPAASKRPAAGKPAARATAKPAAPSPKRTARRRTPPPGEG
ncbi:MAG: hypothetical protein AB7O78_03325 [Thermoleophilia bacterium]